MLPAGCTAKYGIALPLARVRHDHFARLLADHVDRGDDEETGDFRKDRRVDDPQSLRPNDAEAAVDHGHRIIRLSNAAGARSVMPPGVVLDPPGDLLG